MTTTGMVLRILLAAILGFLVGLERKGRGKGAGPRTFALICMGSALFTLLSLYGFSNSGTVNDPARIAAQIVSGIGFIGAGVIWKHGNDIIKGVTTAAGIWAASAIGMAVAANLEVVAVATTVITVIILQAKA